MPVLDYWSIARRLAANCGAPRITRRLLGRKKVAIINYHNPSPEVFSEHLKYFVRQFDPIKIGLFLEAMNACAPDLLPEFPLVITIDDGFRENYRLLPYIESFRVPVILYLAAGLVGTKRGFWFKIARSHGEDVEYLKRLPNEVRLDVMKKRCGWDPEREYAERSALSWDEVHALQKSGFFEFGAHSVTHPILPKCSREEAEGEIAESKRILEGRLQQSIIHFCYPNGDYTEREVELLEKCGFATGRSIAFGWNDVAKALDPFKLRVLGGGETDVIGLKLISGGYTWLRDRLGIA